MHDRLIDIAANRPYVFRKHFDWMRLLYQRVGCEAICKPSDPLIGLTEQQDSVKCWW